MHQVESRRPMSADWTLARSVRWHWPRQYARVCFVGPIIVWCRMVSDQCVFSYWLSMSARESSATRILFSQDSAVGPCLLNIYGWRLQAISGNVNLRPWCKIFFANAGIRCYICCKRVILLPSSACNVHCMVIILYKHHWSCYPETMRFWVHLIRWDKVFQNGFTFTVLFCIKSEWLRAVVLSIWFKFHEQTQCNYVALYDHVLESFNSPIVQIKE